MRSGDFDEVAFFGAIHESGARALLIGRRALVLLGLPVLTADYDFWIAIDDIACLMLRLREAICIRPVYAPLPDPARAAGIRPPGVREMAAHARSGHQSVTEPGVDAPAETERVIPHLPRWWTPIEDR